MALNNCNMSSNSFDEDLGSNLGGRNANDRTLLITPDEGYVLDKDKFTIPSSLPSGVDSITLSNTGFPGEPENNVSVLVAISSSYSASASNNVISLGITGSADLYVKPPEGSENTYANAYVWMSSVSKPAPSVVTNSLVNGVTADGNNFSSLKSSLAVRSGVKTKLLSQRVIAATGKRFLHPPKLSLLNAALNGKHVDLQLDITEVIKDTNNNITGYVYDLNYTSSVDIYKSDLLKYEIFYKALDKPTITNEIKIVDFGSKDVDKNGETRRIRVFGDVGARFSMLAKETGQSAFFDQDNIVIESIGKHSGTKKGVNYKSIDINIPPKSTATTYEVKITPGDETKFNSSLGSPPKTYTLNQFPNPTLTFSATGPGGANYSNPANITKTGRPNKTNLELAYLKTLKTTFDIDYSVTTTSSSISIDKVPELKVFERSGEVKSNDLDRIHLSNTGGLTTGMKVVEHSDDTTVTARTITGITADQYVDVSTDLNAGVKKDFTFLKSDWTEDAVVPFLNGGNKISITSVTATANGQTATIKGTFTIRKFGNASKTLDLNLNNILTES